MTFVQATFVLATFVHIRRILAVTDPILIETLKVAFWEHLEQIPTIKLTFVQATKIATIATTTTTTTVIASRSIR